MFAIHQEKYRWRNSGIIVFSYWANFTLLLAVIKKIAQKACSAMLFTLNLFLIAGGEDFNQFLMDIPLF